MVFAHVAGISPILLSPLLSNPNPSVWLAAFGPGPILDGFERASRSLMVPETRDGSGWGWDQRGVATQSLATHGV